MYNIMKKKLTFLMFTLLLAVGWTASASAQALPDKASTRFGLKQIERHEAKLKSSLKSSDAKVAKASQLGNTDAVTSSNVPLRADNRMKSLTKAEAEGLIYYWDNGDGNGPYDSNAAETATDPAQIYSLLKYVYMTPAFPGPYYNAWTSDNQPEDPVYYGGIAGGWDIPFEQAAAVEPYYVYDNITVTTQDYDSYIQEIYIQDENGNELAAWRPTSSSTATLPTGWQSTSTPRWYSTRSACYMGTSTTGGTITIPHDLIDGNHPTITVYITAFCENSATLTVCGATATLGTSPVTYNLPLTGQNINTNTTPTDVLISLNSSDSYIAAINIYNASNNQLITSWAAGNAVPSSWFLNRTLTTTTLDEITYAHVDHGCTFRIPASLFEGIDGVIVRALCRATSDTQPGLLMLCDSRYYNLEGTPYWYGTTINFPEAIPSETYKPTNEGYTALIVAVKNEGNLVDPEPGYEYWEASEFTDSVQVVNYIRENIDSVKLLTDGMRIGDGLEVGTVFNCDGTYNKFFFLGKGRARKKASGVLASMNSNDPWPSYACEQVPFKFMFEQFSPTTGVKGDEIEDFYSEMMDGHVYKVVHDCASVIQNGHQFSLSGNNGTESFAFKGMNFFIPDYRLKYWLGTDSVIQDDESKVYYDVDGRDMNAYMLANANGKTGVAYKYASVFAVNYAQYNPLYAPKVGLYLITLEATAKPSAGYDPEDPSTRFFDITLTWVSSLDEMTGSAVPQVFTIYYINDAGERVLLDELVVDIENPTNSLTLTYPWPQEATSQTFTYIVEGRGTGEHTPFVAWSNQDDVIIPGFDDFLALKKDHIESDFIIHEQKNYYRNFLTVSSENDMNGLSYTQVQEAPGQEMAFDLYRSVTIPETPGEVKIATLTFKEPTANTVKYEIDYVTEEQDILDYTLKKPGGETVADAYDLENMGIPSSGELRVRGNGDIVIQPNGYHVNFTSIKVKNGNNVIASWTVADGDIVGDNSMWQMSPGSLWVRHLTDDGDVTYYLEGGGYLYLPNILNQYSALTVEIEAFGDGTSIARILVNDESKRFRNNEPETMTWTVRAPSTGGNKAPNRGNTDDGGGGGDVTTADITICDGTDTERHLPVFGYYYDYRVQFNQMLYTASQINLPAGTEITALTFYPQTPTTLNYAGGSITMSLGTTTQSEYTDFVDIVPDDLTVVATFTPTSGTDCSNGWVITFDRPFTYNGGSLLIQVETEIGDDYSDSYFYGTTGTADMGFNTYYDANGSSGAGWYGALRTFQPKMTITYVDEGEDPGPEPTFSTNGIIHMGDLQIVDQFSESTAMNDHPKQYKYVLRYAPQDKESSPQTVDVEHTESIVNGYFTEDDVKNDSLVYNTVIPDLLAADVQMTLPDNDNQIYYYRLQGTLNDVPQEAAKVKDNFDMLAKLQLTAGDGGFHYVDQIPENRPRYEIGPFNHSDKALDEGTFGQDYKSYVPTIMTRGYDRRYFADDTLHNTYGAPIWRTGVGKVDVQNGLKVEKQHNQWGSTDWSDGTNDCSLYILDNVEAWGYLPSNSVSNVDYEPYMFRIYVECNTNGGKLRGFGEQPTDNGIQLINDNDFTNFTGPLCIFSEYVDGSDRIDYVENGDYFKFVLSKAADEQDWEGNKKNYAMFGGLSDIITENPDGSFSIDPNFKVLVRFYYRSKGRLNPNHVIRGMRDASTPPMYYGSEKEAPSYDPSTDVAEFYYHGEIESQIFYNVQGMASDRPFDGVNIVVTRFSDGTTTTTKVVR